MRPIVAFLVGLISGVFFIGLVELLGSLLFPAGIPLPEKRSDFAAYMEQVPFMAKLFVIIAYGAGAFVASTVTLFIRGRMEFRPALVVVCLLQLFAWLNLFQVPHPAWMWIAGSLVIVPAGYIAFLVFRKKVV